MGSSRPEVIRRFVRGIGSLDELAAVGIRVTQGAQGLEIHSNPGESTEVVSLSDVAEGLLRNLNTPSSAPTWAFAVLGLAVDITDLDSVDGQLLLEALWDMASGVAPTADSIESATRLGTPD